VVTAFHQEAERRLIDRLVAMLEVEDAAPVSVNGSPVAGKTVVFTGALEREQAELKRYRR
jgi:DNA ligase (NAD+)